MSSTSFGIGRAIRVAGLDIRSSPFPALVASSAMAPADWPEAGECQLQRQVAAAAENIGLRQPGVRPLYAYGTADGLVYDSLEPCDKLGGRVREWISGERPECHGRYALHVAPDNRLGEQEHITTGQKDRVVGRVRVRHILAANRPVVRVDIRHWHFEDVERPKDGGANRGQKAIQILKFGRLPVQPAADVEWMHRGMIAERLAQEHGTVKSADQDGQLVGPVHFHGLLFGTRSATTALQDSSRGPQ